MSRLPMPKLFANSTTYNLGTVHAIILDDDTVVLKEADGGASLSLSSGEMRLLYALWGDGYCPICLGLPAPDRLVCLYCAELIERQPNKKLPIDKK